MSKDPTNSEGEIQAEVQDYLDLLLAQPTASTSSDSAPTAVGVDELPEQSLSTSGNVRPLTMVAGRAFAAPIHRTPSRSKPAYAKNNPIAKPYEEPSRTIAFKTPLPILKLEPQPDSEQRVTTRTDTTVVESGPSSRAKQQQTLEIEPVYSPPVESGKDCKTLPAEQESLVENDLDEAHEEVTESALAITQWHENGRPSWAQQRFECLMFSVGGLTLAVPLVELGSIYPLGKDLTPLFGQADWFMGLLSIKDSNIRTVNTAKLVMPERYNESMDEKISYVISINTMDWGLAVDTVSNAIVLEPEDVRWRSERSKRPWLAGTVVEHMCALLDVSQLAAMFVAESATQ